MNDIDPINGRNPLKEVKTRLVRESVRVAIQQYGLDDILEALNHTYRQCVYMANRAHISTQERMVILDQAQAGLRKVQGEEGLLRM